MGLMIEEGLVTMGMSEEFLGGGDAGKCSKCEPPSLKFCTEDAFLTVVKDGIGNLFKIELSPSRLESE